MDHHTTTPYNNDATEVLPIPRGNIEGSDCHSGCSESLRRGLQARAPRYSVYQLIRVGLLNFRSEWWRAIQGGLKQRIDWRVEWERLSLGGSNVWLLHKANYRIHSATSSQISARKKESPSYQIKFRCNDVAVEIYIVPDSLRVLLTWLLQDWGEQY